MNLPPVRYDRQSLKLELEGDKGITDQVSKEYELQHGSEQHFVSHLVDYLIFERGK